HLIVFTDAARRRQVWQLARHRRGRPVAFRAYEFRAGQANNALIDMLLDLHFSLAEEEGLTQPDVIRRVGVAFDVDRITRRFYDPHQATPEASSSSRGGLGPGGAGGGSPWVSLTRLFFVSFAQKKGPPRGPRPPPPTRLQRPHQQRGPAPSHPFYRHFLRR